MELGVWDRHDTMERVSSRVTYMLSYGATQAMMSFFKLGDFLNWQCCLLAMTSKKEKPVHSLIAGSTAGAIEAYVVGFAWGVLARRV